MKTQNHMLMSRNFHFAGSVTYIENYYESHEHQHKDSDDSSEMKNDTDEVVFEQSVKVKCASSSAGRSAENLFSTPEGEKDVGLTGKMADAFVKYLKLHHISDSQLSTSDGLLNKSVVAFFLRWSNQGYVSAGVPNGSSITRFLHDDCHLELGVTQKSYGNYIRKKINDGNIDYEVEGFVEDFAKSHNI